MNKGAGRNNGEGRRRDEETRGSERRQQNCGVTRLTSDLLALGVLASLVLRCGPAVLLPPPLLPHPPAALLGAALQTLLRAELDRKSVV